MTQITLWAIKEKSTGNFMPELPGWRRGYTHLDPLPKEKAKPRFFRARGHAVNALTFWSKGPHVTKYSHSTSGFGVDDWVTVEAQPVADKPRNKQDFEIVSFTCTENT